MSNPVAAIFDAILVDDLDKIQAILEKTHYDLNVIRNRDGRTPLMVACQTLGAHKIIRYLCSLRTVNLDLKGKSW
jgi:hypothetical protein